MENIEVDEPIIQKVRTMGSYVKQEMTDDSADPLYTEDYLDASPKRKSPTKRQSTIQNGESDSFWDSFLISKMELKFCCCSVVDIFQLQRRQHHHQHTQRQYNSVSLG